MRLAGTIAFKAAADVTARLTTLAITVVAAHRLPPATFGELAIASTIGLMLGVAADAGLQMHVAREVARAPARAAVVLRRWSRPKAALTAAAAVAVVAIGMSTGSGGDATGRVLVGLAYVVLAHVEFLHHVLRGLSRTEIESTLLLGLRGAMLGLAMVVLFANPRLDLVGLALLVPALGALAVTRRLVHRLAGAPSALGTRVASTWREWMSEVLPIGAGIVLSALYFRIDVLLVDRWLGLDAVARYAAVFRLVEALRLFPAAVLAVMWPAMCRAGSLDTLRRVSASMVLPAAAAAIGLYATAPWIVGVLYGESYAAAVPPLRVLALAFPLLTLNYALTHQLLAWGGQVRFAAACAGALLVNVSLNGVLIPSRGIAGAAWATVGTEVFLTGACLAGVAGLSARRAVALPPVTSLRSRA